MTTATLLALAAAVAAEPAAAPAAALELPSAIPSAGALAAPAAALALLAVAAVLLSRRRRALPRHVQVLETTSLGPRRALVVARLGDELLVLGSSEAGIDLLATRPAPAVAPAAVVAAVNAPAAAPAFDDLLAESGEDLELRRKLARGQAGRVR